MGFRISLLSQILLSLVLLDCSTSFAKEELEDRDRPNILLIVSEDNGPELGCYGDRFAQTPNLDQLATEGIRFETAYVSQTVCSPSRSTIFTGLYPHQNGQIGLATHQYEMFKNWPTTYSILKQAGYRTGLIGKTHVNPKSAIEDWVDFRAIVSSNFAKKKLKAYASQSAKFIDAGDEPFFLTVNYPDAHWPVQNQVEGRPANVVSDDDVKPMPFIGFDNLRLRGHVAGYYNCMSRLDGCVGELLEVLEESGKADNTMVIYIGDHGAQFARGKVFLTEGGLRIPFIVRWPGKTKPGSVSKQLVSTIDLLPTIVAASGTEAPENLPGRSLAPVLGGSTDPIREYLFGERNCDSADLYYPQRAVRDQRYKLIKTLLGDRPDPGAEKCLRNGASNFRGSPTTEELGTASADVQKAYDTWLNPPEYQLYDLQTDPIEFVNLASDGSLADVKQRLIRRLEQWQVETDDPLRKPELLARLTAENDECRTKKIRSTPGGWKYVEYLAPASRDSQVRQSKEILIDVQRIWNAAPHNAFTDLIRWNDKFYCAFRTGTGHVPGATGEDGKIQVIVSEDGIKWSAAATIVEAGIDLRDPKLSITPSGRLMLLMGGSNYDGTKLIDRTCRVAFLQTGANKFSPIQKVKIDPEISDPSDWLWRVTWHKGAGYGIVYQPGATPWGLQLVKTSDGVNYDHVKTLQVKGKPNESTIRFDAKDEMIVVVRNEGPERIGHLGRSQPPYSSWNWKPIKQRLGGPDLIQLPDNSWLLGTRAYGKSATTVLGKLDLNGNFEKLITFPSGGDTSYPGMLIFQDEVWFCYYSSHEVRTSIYLSRIKVADLIKQVD